jgi:adenylyltransferase/sulfurtransferase
MNRYQRHIQLDDFGAESQIKLAEARVLVIGAGGLGCPVLMQLAAMGVGCLGIVDGDKVEWTNLHRQLLYKENHIGLPKAEVAGEVIKSMNHEVKIEVFPVFIHEKNIFSIIEDFDIIVDGTDQIFTRYLINDACLAANKPWVYGAVYQYEGQISIFNILGEGNRNYRDLFPEPDKNLNSVSCNEAGVLGLVPNLIGLLMTNEVVKWIVGAEGLLSGKLLHYQVKNNRQHIFNIQKIENNSVVPDKKTVENTDYIRLCQPDSLKRTNDWFKKLNENPKAILVDVREKEEEPSLNNIPHKHIPMSVLEKNQNSFDRFDEIIFVCLSGSRSRQAVLWAKNNLPDKSVYHVEGGVFEIIEMYQNV